MPVEYTTRCSVCGSVYGPQPELGHLQGQPVQIVLAASAVHLKLCSNCVTDLVMRFARHADEVFPGGTVTGSDKLAFLPIEDARPVVPPSGARKPRRSTARSSPPKGPAVAS